MLPNLNPLSLFEVHHSQIISIESSVATYVFALLIESIELEELVLLFVVIVRSDEDDDEHGEENCETLNPGYTIQIYNIYLYSY